MDISKTIATLKEGNKLSESEASELQSAILSGSVETAAIVEIFSALENRRVSESELRGFFKASVKAMTVLNSDIDTLDTCGTGGDKSGSFNISTTAAIICAAAGVPVAKHGNRAASSKCGSADVLETLGVKIDLTPEKARRALKRTGFVFLFARSYHPAFKNAAEARKTFGKKTYFNLLGPLLNPAKASYRVHGLADFSYSETLGELLTESGVKKAWLIHADDGLDEVSSGSLTHVIEFSSGVLPRAFNIDPKEHGLFVEGNEGLVGGDAKVNAEILSSILQGKGTEAQNSASILNAAAGLTVYGKTENFKEGVKLAGAIVKSGAGFEKLQEIIKVSNEV